MTGSREAVTFDEIIQAGRARSRNEQLANEIFGRNRKSKESNGKSNRSSSHTPSLASRVGIQKSQRSSSSSSTGTARLTPPSRTPLSVQAARTSRLQSALESPSNNQVKISQSRGIVIKGAAAGPFTVVATNFAPGTTAADIESAVANDGTDAYGENALISCQLTSAHRDATVTAELVYSDRAVAEKIVSLYNNQRADGRILKLSIKSTSGRVLKSGRQERQHQAQPTRDAATADEDEEDVDMLSPEPAPDRYNSSRESEAAARARSKEQHRRGEREERYAAPSDSEAGARANGKDTQLREDDTEAGPSSRSRSRNQDQDRERDRDRRDDQADRRYDERQERGSEQYTQDRDRRPYEARPGGWDPPARGGRSSHYGNNVGGGHAPNALRGGGFAHGSGGLGRGGGGGIYAGPRGPRGGSSLGYGRGAFGGRGW